MVPPEIAFQHAANRAAAIYAAAPPFVTYRVATHVSAPSLGKSRDVLRDVAVRTSDDLAVIQDLPQGANALAHGFPVTPVFDALSYFQLSWKVGMHTDVSAFVHDVKPLVYTDPKQSEADVVAVRLRQYKATYAGDSSDAPDGRAHIIMVPYDFVKAQANPDKTFYLSDVVDNATNLPVSVKYAGDDDTTFVCDYGSEQGHWVVRHVHYETTLHGPLRIGLLHVVADANFDNFEFPKTAPDPRLVPPPLPPPLDRSARRRGYRWLANRREPSRPVPANARQAGSTPGSHRRARNYSCR